MVSTILAGLIVAAASGLAVIAYRHPTAYKRIGGGVVKLAGVMFVLLFGWYARQLYTAGKTIVVLSDTHPDATLRSVSQQVLSMDEAFRAIGLSLLLLIGLAVYLAILHVVPVLIADTDSKPGRSRTKRS